MKVCIIHRYPISEAISTNPSILSFIENLRQRGYQTLYVSYRDRQLKYPKKDIEFKELPFYLNRTNNKDKYVKTLLFMFLSPWIAYWVRCDPEIKMVYCDDSLPFYGYLVKRLAGKTVVIRLGDLQTGYLFLKKSMAYRILFNIFHMVELYTWKKVDGVIPISEPFRRYVVSHGVPPDRTVTVPECVDTKLFKPGSPEINLRKKYLLGQNDILVLYHGVIEPLKGLDVLLQLLSENRQYLRNLKFLIIGTGSALPELKRLARRLKISEFIVWIGWVPFSEINDFLNSCDIGIPMRSDNLANHFVVTSALLQYWACAKPVMTPRLEAMEEIVRDGENGYTFSFNAHEEFGQKLQFLLKDREKRRELGQRGREVVLRRYQSVNIGKELCDAIEHFLGSIKNA
jgi:glycosyltransferase involved in cell wall biosynthesis